MAVETLVFEKYVYINFMCGREGSLYAENEGFFFFPTSLE